MKFKNIINIFFKKQKNFLKFAFLNFNFLNNYFFFFFENKSAKPQKNIYIYHFLLKKNIY